jgi:hypothetical protein
MKLLTRQSLDSGLHAKVLVPDDAFKERINSAHYDGGCDQLRPKLGPLGDAARNDRWNGSRKSQKEKDLDQRVTIFGGQFLGPYKKAGAMSPAYPTANYATVES